jgi:hypothetical protein
MKAFLILSGAVATTIMFLGLAALLQMKSANTDLENQLAASQAEVARLNVELGTCASTSTCYPACNWGICVHY